jgi:hypothetical protein
MILRARWVFAAIAALVAACTDRVDAPVRVAPEPTSIATLVVGGTARRSGDIITLSARLASSATTTRAGAFLAHIEYDSTLIAFVGEGDAAGGIAAFHAAAGVLKVAGASLDGYAGGLLFNARFRVARPSSQAEVRLVIDELRDVNASDRLPPQVGARSSLVRPFR